VVLVQILKGPSSFFQFVLLFKRELLALLSLCSGLLSLVTPSPVVFKLLEYFVCINLSRWPHLRELVVSLNTIWSMSM